MSPPDDVPESRCPHGGHSTGRRPTECDLVRGLFGPVHHSRNRFWYRLEYTTNGTSLDHPSV